VADRASVIRGPATAVELHSPAAAEDTAAAVHSVAAIAAASAVVAMAVDSAVVAMVVDSAAVAGTPAADIARHSELREKPIQPGGLFPCLLWALSRNCERSDGLRDVTSRIPMSQCSRPVPHCL
jgi:hypothetical protein